MADKYSRIAAIALASESRGAKSLVSPGDQVTAEVTRFDDDVLLSTLSVGDVLRIGVPLPKGARLNLGNCRLTVFGDATMILTGKLGYQTLVTNQAASVTTDDDAFGALITSRKNGDTQTNGGVLNSFPPVGKTPRVPEEAWLIFTVASVVNPTTTVTAIPDTAVRGTAYFEIEYSIFN